MVSFLSWSVFPCLCFLFFVSHLWVDFLSVPFSRGVLGFDLLYFIIYPRSDRSCLDSRWPLTVSTGLLWGLIFASSNGFFDVHSFAAWNQEPEWWWARDFYFILSPDSLSVFHFVSTVISLPIVPRIFFHPNNMEIQFVRSWSLFLCRSVFLLLREGSVKFIDVRCSVWGAELGDGFCRSQGPLFLLCPCWGGWARVSYSLAAI